MSHDRTRSDGSTENRLRRRRYLAGVGVGLGLGGAGCLGAPDDSSPGGGDDGSGSDGAPEDDGGPPVRIETVASGLEVPWGMAYRGGDLYLTERPGRVVRVRDGGGDDGGSGDEGGDRTELVRDDFPDLEPTGEGGLLGLAFHPDEPTAYTYGTYDGGGGLENRVVRHDLEDGWAGEPILGGIPASSIHDGGRLAICDGALFVTTGDASEAELAQDRDSLAGKVLRLTLDGEPHPDNPFGTAVFTYGHRNPQGLAFREGTLYSTEHGPDTDDEINVLEAGRNYGWPDATGPSGDDEYADPIASYTPTIAPGGAAFYDGPVEAWRGDFFFGTLAGEHLRRVRIRRDDGVTVDEPLFEGEFGRLRTTAVDPDGHLLVATSNRDGRGSPRDGDDRVLRFLPR
ncbi:PQQ-dependent sugar dehydrogenase [Halegenticoccus tardaugens]|uniref:PQQ-dependent sugar dehydrogenase n=1 Tax=Halegenticoccus tardaugens TaxID=2071624 RepID=UPI001E5BD0B1|nr:PQQ-dependent sugar dehydrogenase [Halegenticoccus tardaugens]